MINVDELSDANLRKELISRGVNAGPVVESTRSVYVKKLVALLAQEETQVNGEEINGVLKVIDNVEPANEVPAKIYPTLEIVEEPVRQRKTVRASVEPTEQEIRADDEGASDDEGLEFSRIITEEDYQNDVSQRKRSNRHQKRNIGKFLLILALVLGGVFMFYFADNISKLTALDSDEGI